MRKTTKKQKEHLSKEDINVFWDKFESEWGLYKFHYKIWQKQVQEIKKDFNGFGVELPNVCVEYEILLKNFLELEMKKTKNKKYRSLLLDSLEIVELDLQAKNCN